MLRGQGHLMHLNKRDIAIYNILYRRLGGKKRQLSPIGKSVSVSFRVRVVRACVRAKLCGPVAIWFSTLEARTVRSPPAAAVPRRFYCYTQGFRGIPFNLLLYARVLRKPFQSAAIRKGFKAILSSYCHTQGSWGNPFDLLLYTQDLKKSFRFIAHAMVSRKSFRFTAIRKGCKEILSIYCYTHGF